MFKNAIFFRINADWELPSAVAINEALSLSVFESCGATQRESAGWVEPRGEKHGPLVEAVNGQWIFKLMVESKILPASAVKDKLEERVAKLKEEAGLQRVSSVKKKEMKEALELELLPHCFTKKGATLIWIDPKAKIIAVDAGSIKKADGAISKLIEAFSEINACPNVTVINTTTSPAAAMSNWLTTQEPPAEFSVDRECELKSTDGESAVVRYSRHSLEMKEVVEHIQLLGKVPTKLAMTYKSRLSFILADDLSIKKINILDVAIEDGADKNGDVTSFDADVAIVTGELSMLMPALIEVLGGEFKLGDRESTKAQVADGAMSAVIKAAHANASNDGVEQSAEGFGTDVDLSTKSTTANCA